MEEYPSLSLARGYTGQSIKPKFPRSRAVGNLSTFIVANSYVNPSKNKKVEKKCATPQKNLKGTKICKYVAEGKMEIEGKTVYGACYRDVCTFAHGLDDFHFLECSFGTNCKFINGRTDYHTGQTDKREKCLVRHPNETLEKFISRTGKQLPDLPPTCEHTRRPVVKVDLEELTVEGSRKKAERQKLIGKI